MPHSDAQWLWFAFFGLGAIGGIFYLVRLALEVLRAVRKAQME